MPCPPTHNEVFHQRKALPVVRVAEAELPVRVEAARVHVGVRPRHHQRVVLSAPDRLVKPFHNAAKGKGEGEGGGGGVITRSPASPGRLSLERRKGGLLRRGKRR